MHDQARQWIAKHAPVEPATVLDIGGRDVNGSCRDLFPGSHWTVLDIRPGEGVDIVADAATWDPGGQQWDVVICAEVFEHCAAWRAVCRAALRACKPGGRFIVTTAAPGRPVHSAADGGARLAPGEHYANIRPAELARVLGASGWSGVVVDVQPDPADVRAVAAKPAGKG